MAQQSGFTLVLGGIHAGRHDYARTLASDNGLPVSSLNWLGATVAEACDESLSPPEAVRRHRRPGHLLLLPDISPWLGRSPETPEALLSALDDTSGPLILVSREAGLGIVPLEAADRHARDDLGRLNQSLAQRADRVVLVAAGLPLTLKGEPCPRL